MKPESAIGRGRIAQQLSLIFGAGIDKDVVRRVLAKYYEPRHGSDSPSWLTFLTRVKDSLRSVGLLRCESLISRLTGYNAYRDDPNNDVVNGYSALTTRSATVTYLTHVRVLRYCRGPRRREMGGAKRISLAWTSGSRRVSTLVSRGCA